MIASMEIIAPIVSLLSALCISVAITLLFCYFVRAEKERTESGEADIELIDEALKQRTKEYVRKKKAFAITKKVVFVVLLILIVPLFLYSLISKISGGKPVLGKTIMVVASNSMSKKNVENSYLFDGDLGGQFDKYDIIVLSEVNSPADLKLYDIVAYRNDKGDNVIHRIVGVSGGEEKFYSMRGDANNANDTYHPKFVDIIGVYRGTKIKVLGVIVLFLQSWPGIITLLAILYCLFTADFTAKKIASCRGERTAILKDAMFIGDTLPKEIEYMGFVYRFDENGFADKSKSESSTEGVMIRRTDDETEPQKIIMKKRKNDGKKDQ